MKAPFNSYPETFAGDGGKWVGGYFVIDMTTIRSTDTKQEAERIGTRMLHLKDPDFFDVKKFPVAYFTLLKAVPGANDSSFTLTGQLNLKNITNDNYFSRYGGKYR